MQRMALLGSALVIGLTVTTLAAQNGYRHELGPDEYTESIDSDEEYDKAMRKVGLSNTVLRKAVEGRDRDQVRESAQALRLVFVEVEVFWDDKGKQDASRWARNAREALELIDNRVGDNKWNDVKALTGDLGQTCQSCHGAYRDKAADGTFRIKPGTN